MNVLLLAAALLFSGVKVALAQFSAVTAIPSQIYVGQPVTVTAAGAATGVGTSFTLVATSIYEEGVTTQTYVTTFGTASIATVTFPSASGATFEVSVISGVDTFSTTVTQYSPAIISPTDGATLTPGSTFLASVSVLPVSASSYTITFGNGLYSQVSTIAGNTPVFLLSVPTNFIGSYTLQLTQSTFVDAFTYALPTVSPVWNPVNPNMLFRVGGIPPNYGHRHRHHHH